MYVFFASSFRLSVEYGFAGTTPPLDDLADFLEDFGMIGFLLEYYNPTGTNSGGKTICSLVKLVSSGGLGCV